MADPSLCPSESKEMVRWAGQIETEIESIRREVVERDQRYSERAEAQNKAVEAALAAQKEAVAAALAASDKAVDKAEVNAEKWRDSANEWRGAMDDRDKLLPSRREFEAELQGVRGDLITMRRELDRLQGGEAVKRVVSKDAGDRSGRQIAIAAASSSAFLGTAAIVVTLILSTH